MFSVPVCLCFQAARIRPSAYQTALNAPTKKPIGQFVTNEIAMAAQTVTSAIATDRVIATGARSVNERAAAGGPIMRLNMRRAPTTGSVIAVARATIDQERHLDGVNLEAFRFSDLRDYRRQRERPVEHRYRRHADEPEDGDREDLV